MTTLTAAPTPMKARGRGIAAYASYAVVLAVPWLIGWASGGFVDPTAVARTFLALITGLVLGTGVGALLWASGRAAEVGTGLVRGTLLAFGTTITVMTVLASIYGD